MGDPNNRSPYPTFPEVDCSKKDSGASSASPGFPVQQCNFVARRTDVLQADREIAEPADRRLAAYTGADTEIPLVKRAKRPVLGPRPRRQAGPRGSALGHGEE